MNTYRHGGISSNSVCSFQGASRIGTAALGLAILFATCLNAAPVTLMFEATVGPPRQSFDGFVPPDWNITLQQGDTVSGTFTFEPFDAAPDTQKTTLVQPFDFSIHIKSRTLTTSQYGIEVSNDVWIESDTTGLDMSGPRDRISLACSAGATTPSCMPPTVLAPNPLNWTFLLGLEGAPSILDGADVSPDPFAWRQFDSSLLVTLIDNSAHRSYGFIAVPTTLQAIPEPCSWAQMLFGTCLLLGLGRGVVKSQQVMCTRR